MRLPYGKGNGHGVLPSFHQVTLICFVPKRTALHSQDSPHQALGQAPELGQHCQLQLPWAKSPLWSPQPVPQNCSGSSEVAFCSFPRIIPNLEAVGKCQSVELGKQSIAQVPQIRQGGEGDPSRCLLQHPHFLPPPAPGEDLWSMGRSLTRSGEEILLPLVSKSKIIPDPLSCESFQPALTLCWRRISRAPPAGTGLGQIPHGQQAERTCLGQMEPDGT